MLYLKQQLHAILLFVFVFFIANFNIKAQSNPISPEVIKELYATIKANSFSVNEYLANSKDLSVFVKTLKLSDELSGISEAKDITIFAPINEAFSQFPSEVIAELFHSKNKQKLASIVRYHIMHKAVSASEIISTIDKNENTEYTYTAFNGLPLTFYYLEEDLYIKDDNGYSIKVLQEDILLSNGMIYKIETVLLPQIDNKDRG